MHSTKATETQRHTEKFRDFVAIITLSKTIPDNGQILIYEGEMLIRIRRKPSFGHYVT